MFLRKRAQSTAEYAIVIALIVALAAGVLQTALKQGIRQKNRQAMNVLLDAGKDVTGFPNATNTTPQEVFFTEDFRTTKIAQQGYVDEKILKKGGAEISRQAQNVTVTAVSVEKIEGNTTE